MEQRLESLERLLADQTATLQRRLDVLERVTAEHAALVGQASTQHNVLCESICASNLISAAVLHERGAWLPNGSPAGQPNEPATRQSAHGAGMVMAGRNLPPPGVGRRSEEIRDDFASLPLTEEIMALPPALPNASGLYVCGGHASGITLGGVDRLNPEIGRWETLPAMPTPRHGCAAAAVIGILYVFGGANDTGLPLATAERFDPLLGRWEKLTALPTARHGSACAAVAGLLYVVGGYDGEGVLSTTERFDPAAGRWEVLPLMPTARGRCAAASLEGLVYAVGGATDDGREVSVVECFNPGSCRWTSLEPMPTARCGCSAVAVNGSLFVVGGRNEAGGRNGTKKLATAERLDLALGKWEVVAPMPTARDGCAAASIADVIYVFGGRGVGQTLPAVERYDPRTGRWEQLPAMPQARCGCAAASAER